ncbi:MAG: hypothetical protein GW878_03815 [Acidobacteria bacterium]|nr:hypothetical protein [Acidobacteriota bacterium]
MKLLMLIVDGEHKEELEVFLQRSGISGFTELPGASGFGTTGPRLHSRAYPKTSAVIFSVVEDEDVTRLKADVDAYCRDCGERLRMIAWGVEAVL